MYAEPDPDHPVGTGQVSGVKITRPE
jgi:hypothetical protein